MSNDVIFPMIERLKSFLRAKVVKWKNLLNWELSDYPSVMGYLILYLIAIFIVLILFLGAVGLCLGCWVKIGTLGRLAR